ncbi:hypothetical protein M408DRAFT_279749 [Serendipita vermifera MAFF 305830]|uniref:Uncharacterized protein n=1 Tax=Serendipita vermifera MAFF 305830 TaxID=933852 RepID=A0A0C3ARX3_SERVB|nr:hypothetical protein M408DRAFT_279749 [Serendipita vermifera MAFF 305830]
MGEVEFGGPSSSTPVAFTRIRLFLEMMCTNGDDRPASSRATPKAIVRLFHHLAPPFRLPLELLSYWFPKTRKIKDFRRLNKAVFQTSHPSFHASNLRMDLCLLSEKPDSEFN